MFSPLTKGGIKIENIMYFEGVCGIIIMKGGTEVLVVITVPSHQVLQFEGQLHMSFVGRLPILVFFAWAPVWG